MSLLLSNPRVAVLYQAIQPPVINGIVKPPKPGGYADSGADIAYGLRSRGIDVVLPTPQPNPKIALDWVWPDTTAGIAAAIQSGANTLWANTVLFKNHPLVTRDSHIRVVGQRPESVQTIDDKFSTNILLQKNGLPVSRAFLLHNNDKAAIRRQVDALGFTYPMVVKPIRGRGSQGVQLVENLASMADAVHALLTAKSPANGSLFGTSVLVEEYLPGDELTVTVMPSGTYVVHGRQTTEAAPWALPPVRRINHVHGVAPYSGIVAVTENSRVLTAEECAGENVQAMMRACVKAATIVDALAPIRIDCRSSSDNVYKLFDLNMKPNMTGPGRPGRDNQDSLSSLAARAISWQFEDLLLAILAQAW